MHKCVTNCLSYVSCCVMDSSGKKNHKEEEDIVIELMIEFEVLVADLFNFFHIMQ